LEYKNHQENLEIKSEQDFFEVKGYASVFNVIDNYNDIILPGAFKQILDAPEKIKFLWQHDHKNPIGKIKRLYEDQKGLFMEALIDMRLMQGKDAALLIKEGAIDGLSIGFTISKFKFSKDNIREIEDLKLWEISIVTFPANSMANITNSNNKKGDFMEEQRIENMERKLLEMEKFIARPALIEQSNLEDDSFSKYLKSGTIDMELKSLSSLDNTSGGYTVLPALYRDIIGAIKPKSPMRNLASLENISTNSLDIIIEKEHFASAWVMEGAERRETDHSKLLQKRINVHELYAQPKATQKLLDDAEINIQSWIIERLADSFARAENNAFILGDGDNKPHGILSYPGNEIERMDASEEGVLKIDDLLNLINMLDESYLSNAHFLMHRSAILEVQKLKDANGRFLWQSSLAQNVPDTLLGIPVISVSDMPRIGRGELSIALGDFKECYKIVDRSDISIMRDPFTEKPFVKFYSVKRVGGDIVNNNAIKLLKC
jgi:HK97 family phage major capsid protein